MMCVPLKIDNDIETLRITMRGRGRPNPSGDENWDQRTAGKKWGERNLCTRTHAHTVWVGDTYAMGKLSTSRERLVMKSV